MLCYSPLRYPGGKARVARFIQLLFRQNELMDGQYVEPYCGGASVALALLFGEYARKVHINDLDPAIYSFWWAVLNETDALCSLVEQATLTVDEWREQRSIYRSHDPDRLKLGFATFYLNRTNRSGIIASGGVIGGLNQTGEWKIDARFNRVELVQRIRKIARYRDRIVLTSMDASVLLEKLNQKADLRTLVYLDPPYFEKGKLLYTDYYQDKDHGELAKKIADLKTPWVVSYDNADAIRAHYGAFRRKTYGLRYSAADRVEGKEIMFFAHNLLVPLDVEPLAVTNRQLSGRQQLIDTPPMPRGEEQCSPPSQGAP